MAGEQTTGTLPIAGSIEGSDYVLGIVDGADSRIPVTALAVGGLTSEDVGAWPQYDPALPVWIFYDVDTSTWPAAPNAAGLRVIWVQPAAGGPAPPSGGRPGREAGDLVWVRQEDL